MRAKGLGLALFLTSFGTANLAVKGEALPLDLDRWLAFRSVHFQLYSESDVITARETLKHLESFRAVLERFSPDLQLVSPAPIRIFLFDSAASYEPYRSVSQHGVNILGQFVRHGDSNYITMQVGNNPLGALAVGSHEYVHYLVQTNFPHAPAWFDEGLAEYYSTFAVEEGVAIVGRPVTRHLRRLGDSAGMELDSLLRGNDPIVHQGEGDQTERNYALSWALVHYLLSTEELSDKLIEVLAGLSGRAEPADPADLLQIACSGGRYRLEAQLATYLARAHFPITRYPLRRLGVSLETRLETVSPPALLTHLGHLAKHSGRPDVAVGHFAAALDFDSEHSEALAGPAAIDSFEAHRQ